MEYITVTVKVIFILFVVFSVNKTLRENQEKGIARIAQAFVWVGVMGVALLVMQIASILNFVSGTVSLNALDWLSCWALAYIISWLFKIKK